MPIPLQITYRGFSAIPSVDALIEEQVGSLERFAARIVRCHVTLGLPHRHHRNGRQYSVHLDITTPLGDVLVTRDPDVKGTGEELDVLVRDAFMAATRQLQESSRRRRSA
jgi:sigma 54 modulation/S30EA-like ribosomal protein